jgi:3-phosphoshikimate 1-carboxyvinyltransferase
VSGAGELRFKESDRLAALAVNLGRLGVAVAETPDGLAITGGPIGGGDLEAAGDHRIAMALTLIATRASEPITVSGADGIPTSYPGFLDTLASLTGGPRRP